MLLLISLHFMQNWNTIINYSSFNYFYVSSSHRHQSHWVFQFNHFTNAFHISLSNCSRKFQQKSISVCPEKIIRIEEVILFYNKFSFKKSQLNKLCLKPMFSQIHQKPGSWQQLTKNSLKLCATDTSLVT